VGQALAGLLLTAYSPSSQLLENRWNQVLNLPKEIWNVKLRLIRNLWNHAVAEDPRRSLDLSGSL
jgi:hypothetical protein